MKSRRKSNAHDESEPGHERWLVSYADFITLMFAFFAVLYATSQKDVEKSKQFQDSIKKFLIKAGGAGGAGGTAATVNQAESNASPIEQPIDTYRTPAKAEAAKVQDEAEEFIESKLTPGERRDFILDVAADDWGLRISLKGEALYDEGSDKFRPEAVPFITKLSGLLAETKRKVLIEGHVARGDKGSYKSTWDFASARAVNLLRFMQTKEHLASARLAVASLGDSRPVYEGERAPLNSRSDVVLLNSDMDF